MEFRLMITGLLALAGISLALLVSGYDVGATFDRFLRAGEAERQITSAVAEECDSCSARHSSLQRLQSVRTGGDADQETAY